MNKKDNDLYTTVTLSNFKDSEYINRLRALNIGMELALLTPLSSSPTPANIKNDLKALKKEMDEFKRYFDVFNIPVGTIRIHQPGGYMYSWFSSNEVSGFDALKEFFSYCAKQGFKNFVIHTPYGNVNIPQDQELIDYREKLNQLAANGQLEVEEIAVPDSKLGDIESIRLYKGALFEQLMEGQRATILLDTNECGGVEKAIERLRYLNSKGFSIRSMHIHQDGHKFLTKEELKRLLQSGYSGNLINEGFVRDECSFDQFVKTKSADCVVPNDERINQLKGYMEVC